MANVKASIAVAALCVLCTASALAQVQAPDLSQMDLEDLMTVQVETVSGASKIPGQVHRRSRINHHHHGRRNSRIRLPHSR